MQPLTLSFVQSETRWHDPAANRRQFANWFDAVPDDSQVIVLPEMFSTGFTMSAVQFAESMSGPTVAWLQAQARTRAKVICGSLVVEEAGRYFNRFVWVTPDGIICYDKRHRFRLVGEHESFSAGTQRVVVPYGDWRICPMICYDLRFPVWFRNRGDYDVLLCVANWPAPRRAAWISLLRARAIENQCYIVGVNIVGVDGNSVSYAGDSAVFSPEGESLMDARDAKGVFTVTLDGEMLAEHRNQFPAWQDADAFRLLDAQD
jgi:omega-amidase